VSSPIAEEIAPDLARIIGEACWGQLWTRPALSTAQRSLATISIITALRRDFNLKGHIESGLYLGFSPEQIVEIMIQLIFYVGAPIANTGLRIVYGVFQEQGIKVDPYRLHDPDLDPEELYRRGLDKRREILGEGGTGDFQGGDGLDQEWERYMVEYLWGLVWTRPGLDLQSRAICTLTVHTIIGTDRTLADYIRAARNLGLTETQIKELFFHLTFYIGVSLARRASTIADEIFKTF
jgi:4-carboxymuconolactone decarboxylase